MVFIETSGKGRPILGFQSRFRAILCDLDIKILPPGGLCAQRLLTGPWRQEVAPEGRGSGS